MKIQLSIEKLTVYVCFFCIYILPSHEIEQRYGIQLDQLVFGVLLLILFFWLFIKQRNGLNAFDLFYLGMMLICCIYQQSVTPVVVMTPLLAGKLFARKQSLEKVESILYKSWLPYTALVFSVFYSVFYGMQGERFLHTGLYEINTSGLAIFLLALIIRKRNLPLGNAVLVMGLLSLSRNYFLALVIWSIGIFINKKGWFKDLYKSKFIDLRFITVFFSIILYGCGYIAVQKYNAGDVIYYTSYKDRILHFWDYANYFRFSVVFFMFNIFLSKPSLWLTGCKHSQFIEACYQYARESGQWYRGNNPHNFFLSYLKLYGISGVLDVYMVGKVMKTRLCRENVYIYLAVVTYAIFLSVSFNGEWLFVVIFIMYLYRDNEEKTELRVCDKKE